MPAINPERFRKWLSLGWAVACVAWCASAHAQSAPTAPFTTRHSGVFGGQRIDYVATVEETLVNNERGEPAVRFVSTSYIREGADSPTRPVIFAFNGGPSVSSATLHMIALGPRHIAITQDPAQPPPDPPQLLDNPQTVLDVADLVFVDPAETGFTRILPAAKREDFYSANGDAAAVSNFVRTWIAEHGRERSAKFLIGESYGTIRATLMAGMLAESMPLDGVFLFGQAINIVETSQRAQNMLGYVTNLPALSAVAAYHGKVDLRGRFMSALIDEAYAWGMSEYLDALVQGRDLPERNRRAVAKRLQSLTGVPADYYLAHDLIVSKVEFAKLLLQDQRLIMAAYDGRYVGPAPQPGGEAADPMSKVTAAMMPLLAEHMSQRLGVTWPMTDYRAAAPDAGRTWQWNPTGGIAGPFLDYDYPAQLTKAFAANPRFRLMIGTGIYDLTTTVGPARYLVAKSNWPRERVFLRQYEGGHMAYTHEPSRRAFCADIRALVTGRAL